jgi:hypothetical protein
VRHSYLLSRTEDELVTLAAAALTLAQDQAVSPVVRLTAMKTYQGLVRQLALEDPHGQTATTHAPAHAQWQPRRF